MPVTARLGRAVAAGALALSAMVGIAGCQFQTLQQYTPAEGVNTAIGGVMARDLVILVTGPGEGVLLGTLVGSETDTLQSVNGVALRPDGAAGSALQVTTPGTVSVNPHDPTVLLDKGIHISSTDLRAGLTARVELTFAKSGSVTIVVPVLDKDAPEYSSVEIPSAGATTGG